MLGVPGTRIGTEGYAPMEHLRSGQAYPSSDHYSLGVTCLHGLTGCRPEDLYQPMEGRWVWQERLQVKTLVGSAGMVKSVAWAKDGSLLISGGLDNTVRLWNPQTEVNSHILSGHTNTVNQVAVSPDGQGIASTDTPITLWQWPP